MNYTKTQLEEILIDTTISILDAKVGDTSKTFREKLIEYIQDSTDEKFELLKDNRRRYSTDEGKNELLSLKEKHLNFYLNEPMFLFTGSSLNSLLLKKLDITSDLIKSNDLDIFVLEIATDYNSLYFDIVESFKSKIEKLEELVQSNSSNNLFEVYGGLANVNKYDILHTVKKNFNEKKYNNKFEVQFESVFTKLLRNVNLTHIVDNMYSKFESKNNRKRFELFGTKVINSFDVNNVKLGVLFNLNGDKFIPLINDDYLEFINNHQFNICNFNINTIHRYLRKIIDIKKCRFKNNNKIYYNQSEIFELINIYHYFQELLLNNIGTYIYENHSNYNNMLFLNIYQAKSIEEFEKFINTENSLNYLIKKNDSEIMKMCLFLNDNYKEFSDLFELKYNLLKFKKNELYDKIENEIETSVIYDLIDIDIDNITINDYIRKSEYYFNLMKIFFTFRKLSSKKINSLINFLKYKNIITDSLDLYNVLYTIHFIYSNNLSKNFLNKDFDILLTLFDVLNQHDGIRLAFFNICTAEEYEFFKKFFLLIYSKRDEYRSNFEKILNDNIEKLRFVDKEFNNLISDDESILKIKEIVHNNIIGEFENNIKPIQYTHEINPFNILNIIIMKLLKNVVRDTKNLTDFNKINIVFNSKELNVNNVKVTELNTPAELSLEGNYMNHCVGGYASNVEYGQSVIFKIESKDDKELRYTFELKPTYNDNQLQFKLIQVRGKRNADAKKEHEKIVNYIIDNIKELLKSRDYKKLIEKHENNFTIDF